MSEPSELATDETPPVTQAPVMSLKQPPASCIPFPNVEVAEVEKTSNEESLKPPLNEEVAVFKIFKCVACRPPVKVEVPATDEETVKGPAKVEVAPLPRIVVVEVSPPTKMDGMGVAEGKCGG